MPGAKKGFLQIASISLLTYPISFANQMLLSYYFGVSQDLDGYFLALTVINLLIFYLGPAQEVLIPRFYNRFKENAEAGWLYFSQTSNLLLLSLLVILALLWLWPVELVLLVVPSADREMAQITAGYLRLLSPLLLLLPCTNLLNSLLISFHRFVFQNLGRLLGALVSVAALVLLAKSWGVMAVALGMVASTCLLLLLQGRELKHLHLGYRLFSLPKTDRSFLTMTGWLILGYGLAQLHVLAERSTFVAFGQGVIAAFAYGSSLSQIPQNVVIMAVVGVLWPQVLAAHQESDPQRIFGITHKYAKKVILLFSWLTLAMWSFAGQIIAVVYRQGAFGEESWRLTTLCFESVVMLMLPFGLASLFLKSLLAMQESKRSMGINLWAALGGVATLGLGYQMQSLRLITLHSTVASSLMALSAYLYLCKATKKTWDWQGIKGAMLWWGKLLLALGLGGLPLWWWSVEGESKLQILAQCLGLGALSLVLYSLLLVLLKLQPQEELLSWKHQLMSRLRRS